MTRTFSQFITDIARKSTAYVEATNESYIQYEKATGTQIIQRGSSGEAIRGDNSGIYQLIPDKDLTKTRGRNDEIDAFRHAYSATKMAKNYGQGASHFLGDSLELIEDTFGNQTIGKDGVTPEQAKRMDLWSNALGRNYANELGNKATNDQISNRVMQGIRNQELIINPKTDQRAYTGGSWADNYIDDPLHTAWNKINSSIDSLKSTIGFGNVGSSNFNSFNFQISNPIQSEQFGNYTWIMIGVTNS